MSLTSNTQAFARKYRPRRFEDVVGQPHVSNALKISFGKNPMSHHAFLFTGTRGVGKTTLARICAKLANCNSQTTTGEPCLTCNSCLEIEKGTSINYTELDGASNNGVEHIRQLIDTTQYMPVDAKKKIYVIDEVHMLSQSAFNALLKTLEEPPEHVIFIFATTEAQKIPETILSRCLRFDLRSLSLEALFLYLKNILDKEGISLDSDTTLKSIAHCARGSVRDALNLLEQVLALSTNKRLTDELVSLSLGRLEKTQTQKILQSIIDGDTISFQKKIKQVFESSIDLDAFCLQIHDELFAKLQQFVKDNSGGAQLAEYFWLFEQMSKDFQWVTKTHMPSNSLHAVLLKYTLRHTLVDNTDLTTTQHQNVVAQKKKRELTAEELWREVYGYLQTQSPTSATVWAHTWGEKSDNEIKICYKLDDKFIVEAFMDNQWWGKVKSFLANLLEIDEQELRFNSNCVEGAIQEKNILEKEDIIIKNRDESRTNEILQDTGVRQIESIFSAKVDKVQLK